MRKLSAFLGILLSCLSLIALTACGDTNKPLSIQNMKNIIQMRYGTKVYFVSDNTGGDYKGNVWFQDVSGFNFRVECDYTKCDWDFLGGKTYEAYEHYIPAYYAAHPELFEIFSEDGHKFEIDEHGNHILYFDSFDDIDDLAEFACDCVEQISLTKERLTNAHYLWDRDIKLYFKPANFNYEWEGHMCMSIPNHFYTPETLSNELKKQYIHELQRKNDDEHLAEIPHEIIKKHS
ncbi:MAG: hypothetical protein E7495_06480 [Ruminococcus flavefaciens]|nr:hypothetical protein [Ruminococcus flavefaciens]